MTQTEKAWGPETGGGTGYRERTAVLGLCGAPIGVLSPRHQALCTSTATQGRMYSSTSNLCSRRAMNNCTSRDTFQGSLQTPLEARIGNQTGREETQKDAKTEPWIA